MGWWSSTQRVGVKSSTPPSKGSFATFEAQGEQDLSLGCPRNFAGMSRTPGGVQEVVKNEVCAQISAAIFLCVCAQSKITPLITPTSSVLGNYKTQTPGK